MGRVCRIFGGVKRPGGTRAEVLGLIREAIEACLEAMDEDGEAIPAPQAYELTEV